MTRNNLDEQLAWLLRAKPSIPPANSSLPPATTSLSPIRPSQSILVNEPVARDPPPQPITYRSQFPPPPTELAERATEMAKLRTTPSSASKPRITSMGSNEMDSIDEKPVNGYDNHGSRSTNLPAPVKTTPIKSSKFKVQSPDDIEIMDLTEELGAMGSPTPRAAIPQRSSRKRKSDEYASDLGTSRQATRPVSKPVSPVITSSGGFSAIDDVLSEACDPPPPYSTVAPKSMRRTGPVNVAAVPDSDEEEDIVSFTEKNPYKRSRIEDRPDSAGPSRISDHQGTSRGNSAAPESTSTVKTEPHRLFAQFTLKDTEKTPVPTTEQQTEILPNAKTPPSNSGTQEPAGEHSKLLKEFFAMSEADLDERLSPLQNRFDSLIEDVAAALDDGAEDGELEQELDELERRINAIKELSSYRANYLALNSQKDQLFAALKQALKSRQGKEQAVAANTACKDKIRTLENECLTSLRLCQQDVENIVAENSKQVARKSVTIQSTQAPAARVAEPSVPSSSKVMQTQIAPHYPPPTQSHSNASYSRDPPTRVNNSFSGPPTFAQPKQIHFDDFDDVDEDEEMMAADQNRSLYSHRMGTPPSAPGHHDEDDFGIGDDDDGMLEMAQDMESNGFAMMPANHRPVFKERSPNSQPPPGRASEKRPVKQRPPVPPSDLEGRLFSFAWSDEVKSTLKERFRLRGFRENQLEAINSTLGGKDAFVLMPTGGGKSLCYQLPALVRSGKTRGVTVVISPLLSLMEDQVQHLRDLRIQAFLINSETDRNERTAIMNALEEPNAQDFVQLLYVTPEMLSKSNRIIGAFESLYRRKQLARLVIDEAHCVSQWGHDFRPDYKLIGDVRGKFPSVPVIALTATATENVKIDVIHNLNIKGCDVFTRSFNRPNLYYEVRPKTKAKEDLTSIANLIKDKHNGQTGIIYCLSRKNCEDFAQSLTREHNIKAHHYHAGMESAEKKGVQKKWQAGEYKVIVATIAFGMGIDKANVRFVVHHSMPKSLEGYYQETGRAGRDGKLSGCYLYYGYSDASKLRRMIEDGEGSWEQKDRQKQMLQKMIQYCENRSDCRRVLVLAYFSEAFQRSQCAGQCDNCNSSSTFHNEDFTEYAQHAVEIVEQMSKDKVTILQCMDVFRGHKSKKVKDCNWQELEHFGAGSGVDRENIERLFYRLLGEGAFRENNMMNRSGFATAYLELGPNSRLFKGGKKKLELEVRSTPNPKKAGPAAKKKTAKEAKDDQSKNWKTTAGSRSRTELPLSTNVSSPIQQAVRQKAARQPSRPGMNSYGYGGDHVIVSDPEDNDYDESDDDFGPVRIDGMLKNNKRREVGPPIKSDNVMDQLDEIHRMVVDEFMVHAKDESQRLVGVKGLRTVPFTDTMLREMAIHFTETNEQMIKKIPDINKEKVALFGKYFVRLVKSIKIQYQSMSAGPGEIPDDPNAQNVIDLISDDEDDDDEEDDFGSINDSDLEDDGGEPSAYFQQAPDVERFNALVAASQPQGRPAKAAKPSRKPSYKGKKRQYTAKGAAGNSYRSGSRYPSAGSTSGVTKPKGRRTKTTSRASGGGTSRGGTGRSGGNGGISMMPT